MAKEIMEGLIKTDKGIVKIVGHDGATFVPHISDDYVLSWTNDQGLENPDPVQLPISKGEIAIGEEEPKEPNVLVWIDTGNVSVKYRDPETGTFAEVQSGGGTDDGSVKKHNVSETAHNDIRLLLAGLSERLNAIADSDDTTLDQLSEIVAYIKANKTLIDSITTNKVNVSDIIDNLTTSVSNKPLSAKMGVELADLVRSAESVASSADAAAYRATENAESALNHAQSAMDLASSAEQMASAAQTEIEKLKENGVPGGGAGTSVEEIHIGADEPTDGEKLWIDLDDDGDGLTAEDVKNALGYTPANAEAVGELSEAIADQQKVIDSSVLFTAQTLTEAQKAQVRANIGATAGDEVEFADSVEWLNENGDTSKKYVLPDGFIYVYTQKNVTVQHNANDGTGFLNIRPSATSGSDKDANSTKNGLFTTAPIPVDTNWDSAVLNISGLDKLVPTFYASLYIYYFDPAGKYLAYCANNQLYAVDGGSNLTNGVAEVDIPLPVSIDLTRDSTGKSYFYKSGYIRVAVGVNKTTAITDNDIKDLVINIDRLNSTRTESGWYSTGQQHSNDKATQQNSADIAVLKEDVADLKEAVQKSPSASGAKWVAIGDSITYGLYSTSATEYSQPVIGQRWVDYVAKYNGYEITNLGVSGSGFVSGTTFRTIVNRNDFSGVDLVTIMLGINDWKNTDAVNKVGTMDDDISTGGTIVSELRYGLEKIISDNPYCKIILITPINAKIGSRGTEDSNWAYGFAGSGTPCGSLKNFGDKLKEVCEYYGVQVVDMTNSSVVNRKSITTVLPDGIHPNLKCYKALGLELARRITFA